MDDIWREHVVPQHRQLDNAGKASATAPTALCTTRLGRPVPQHGQLYNTGKANATAWTALQHWEGQCYSTDSSTTLGRPVPQHRPGFIQVRETGKVRENQKTFFSH